MRVVGQLACAWSVLGLIGSSMSAAAAQPASADTIYVNGKVYTADARDTVAEAFALSGDRFVAVGSNEQIRKVATTRTRIVDLKGRFVSPGLADGHFHNEGGGTGIDLSHSRGLAELAVTVANAASASTPGTLLISNGDWHEAQLMEQRLPTARELDEAAPNNPVMLVRGGHSYILNGKALAKFNITKETPAPPGARSATTRRVN